MKCITANHLCQPRNVSEWMCSGYGGHNMWTDHTAIFQPEFLDCNVERSFAFDTVGSSDDEQALQRLNCWLSSMTQIFSLLFQLRCCHFAQALIRCFQRTETHFKSHIFYSLIIMNCHQHSLMFALPTCCWLHGQLLSRHIRTIIFKIEEKLLAKHYVSGPKIRWNS